MFQGFERVQALEGCVAGADDDGDGVAQAGEVDEGADDGGELGVALEAEVLLASSFAESVAEEDTGISDIATQLNLQNPVNTKIQEHRVELTIVCGFTSAIRSVTILPLSSPTFMRYFLVRAYSSMAWRTLFGEPLISSRSAWL